ncbi:MAG TPA: DUF2851 family protein [Thermomicrobiales bacterium]|nr:DUF2851 family protein [Thermomicrobiales bacterium]
MTAPLAFPEIALSAVWRDQAFTLPLRTVDGRAVEVVNRGVWTHGFGPDFRDAMILLDGRELCTGSIEIHHRTSSWHHHGHDADPRYDDVVLHVVYTHDGGETRRHNGGLVPVVEIAGVVGELLEAPATSSSDWSRFGGPACAPELTASRPRVVREILHQLGDVRLAAKAASMEAALTALTPGEVLYQHLCDGLGYRANREPMRVIAGSIPLRAIEALLSVRRPPERRTVALGLLFGVAGFLPLASMDAGFARITPDETPLIEEAWLRHGAAWHDQALPPTAWTRARVRPANHPAARITALATVVINALERGGLVAALISALRADQDTVQTLRDLATAGSPLLGQDRATAIVTNGLIPFALALAEQASDFELLDAASSAWERLPSAGTNETVRRATRQVAGNIPIRALGARGHQGLIHLDTALCAPRRCYECPIAHRVLAEDGSR